jgi:hypothetical protein
MVDNSMLEILKLILQYSGLPGVVLLFWHLDSVRQSKQFNTMWTDHQELTRCVIESVNNNTKALENLKGYIKTAIKHPTQNKNRKNTTSVDTPEELSKQEGQKDGQDE